MIYGVLLRALDSALCIIRFDVQSPGEWNALGSERRIQHLLKWEERVAVTNRIPTYTIIYVCPKRELKLVTPCVSALFMIYFYSC